MASQITTGKDVLSFCGKCKLNLSHTIVAMKDEKSIAKVVCNTCKSTHAYKDPSVSSASKTRTKKTRSTGTTKVISIADLWMDSLNKTTAKSQAYTIAAKYKEGDVIDHSKFGPGIVQSVKDNTIQVVFRHDIKTLVHNKL